MACRAHAEHRIRIVIPSYCGDTTGLDPEQFYAAKGLDEALLNPELKSLMEFLYPERFE